MKKEYDYTMDEADLKKKPVWSLGEIKVAVSENGDPNKIDVFEIYHKNKKTTTYAEYEKLLGLAEKDRFRMITDIRRRIYQLFERAQNEDLAFRYMLKDYCTGFECADLRSVARRLGDCKNGYGLTDHCDWDWKSAVLKICNTVYHVGGKRYTDEALLINVSSEYRDDCEMDYKIPTKLLHPKYDFENDPVYKENQNFLETEFAYEELFHHNSVKGEQEILRVLANHPDVVKELSKSLGDAWGKCFDSNVLKLFK